MKNLNKGIISLITVTIIFIVVLIGGGVTYYYITIVKTPKDINQENGMVSGDKVFDLSNSGLKSIPMSIFSQINIEELDVSHNYLTGAIQSQIGKLINLKVINASYNQMTGVPAEIGQLKNLQILDLSYNQLTGLPNELGNLSNLRILNLIGNSYSQQDLDSIRNKLPTTVNIIVD